jgi:short subunit dehydrogenase-like uncharacterized protein
VIALYGATGFQGRLVADELVRRGAELVLAGRSEDKLKRLSEERGGGAPIRTASVDEPSSLRAMLEGCEVVINCAGPFSRYGEPVVRAAVESATHYVDPAGEQAFVRAVFERYGPPAEQARVALVPALGFDIAPADCIARLAARDREPLAEVLVAYAVDLAASRGTALSALETLGGEEVVFRGGGWQPAPRAATPERFDFPPPVGRQPMMSFPGCEVITVPRHTRTQAVTVLVSASALAPHPALAPAVGFLRPVLSAALRTPLRHLATRLVQRLPEGPSERDRKAAEFTVVVEARGEAGGLRRGVVHGRDPYGLTAVTLAYGAQRMACGAYDRAGALGPAAAYEPEPFLDHLTDRLRWELVGD